MLRHICILTGLVIFSSAAHAAPSSTFIIEDQEVADSDPSFEPGSLRGKRLWLGDNNGDAGSAKFIRKGNDRDKVVLNEEFQSRMQLGFDQEAKFLPVRSARLNDRIIEETIRATLAGWQGVDALEFYKAVEADLNGDGVAEQIIKVNAPRAKGDPYAGDGGALEGLFVLHVASGHGQVLGQILPKRGSDKDPRTNIDLLAIGQNPSTGVWNLLVRAESQQWEESETTFSVTVNGQTETTQSDRSRSRQTQIDVYQFSGDGLAIFDALRQHSWGSCFGSKCD